MLLTGKNGSKTLRVDADFSKTEEKTSVCKTIRIHVDMQKRFENATCERGFFSKTGEKDLCLQKYPDTCGQAKTI